jgi:nucleoside-diphosphate-sugar epimerase
MKLPRLRTILLAPLILFALFYLTGVIIFASHDRTIATFQGVPAGLETIAIFGASGTAGGGILKAALADPDVGTIHVITRRATPRIEEGAALGKVQVTTHMDYLDYSAIREQVADVDAVYWAIGLSSWGVDEETYGMIHVDFPVAFAKEWLDASNREDISFHYISSSDISDESTAMWAREKVRAEKSLFAIADGTRMRVVAYRPDYIGPTQEEAHIGQKMLYGFFRPVGAAVKATEIGQAMLEVAARGDEFDNGDKLGTFSIMRYADAYARRQQTAGE